MNTSLSPVKLDEDALEMAARAINPDDGLSIKLSRLIAKDAITAYLSARAEQGFREMPDKALDALEFYADPENWFGVYCTGRSPIVDDWEKIPEGMYPESDGMFPDGKPGKLAREVLTMFDQHAKDSSND